jgi:hypothetical protein
LLALITGQTALTPYSLSHGYAWRGHKAYDRSIPVRDLAALMVHNPAAHQRHCGKWTDEAGLEEAVARALGANVLNGKFNPQTRGKMMAIKFMRLHL